MRNLIRRLGHFKVIALITISAIISAEIITYAVIQIFSFPYHLPSTPIVTFLVTVLLAPLILWPLIKLLLFIDELEQKMYNLATYDSMTKLFSRQAFFKRALSLHETFKESNRPYSVCIIDIDNFKSINDTYGHACGDKVLINFGEIFSKIFDSSYIIGRVGGEEFAVVVDTDANTLKEEMDKLHQKVLNTKVPYKNNNILYTISMGIFENKTPNTFTFDEALSNADDALYEAKVTDKNKTVIFSNSLSIRNVSKKTSYSRYRKS